MLIFKKVRFKNILSYGNNFTEFDFCQNRTVLFQGDSGSGKSTILSALTFCLFGKPFTNIRKANLVNSINNGALVAEVEFTLGKKDFKVIRGIKPNIFEIYENEKLITQDAANIDYQHVLENQILKFNLKTFLQIVILGSANFIPFMQLSAGERRNIVEEILDITAFTRMNERLKEDAVELKTQAKDLEHKKNLLETEIDLHTQYKEKAERANEERKTEIENSLTKLKEEAAKLYKGIEEISENHKKILADKNKILTAISKLRSAIDSNEVKKKVEIAKLEKQLEYFSSHENCELCLQGIHADHKNSIIEKLNSDKSSIDETYTKENEAFSQKIVALENSKTFKEISVKEQTLTKGIALLKEKHSLVALKSTTLKDELKTFENAKKPEENKIEEKKIELASVDEEYTSVMSELQICEFASVLLKDNGIKTDIIKEYLPLINSSINEYLTKMNFYVKFTLDESFSEKIEARGRDDFQYDCFSEGEKQRLDLAILFTWRKIAQMKNSLNCNLLIMDEIADSKLNNEAAECVWDVLKSPEFQKSNVFVISHKTTLNNKFEKVYYFSKKGNFTIVEDSRDE